MDRITPNEIAKILGVEEQYNKLLLEQQIIDAHNVVMGESTLILDYTPLENEE
jgi:hypothetical protein